ncbi:MAG: hypothetical protein COB23_09475 [Methylophaga sp.]|nr:MAG: hypothetical protein COB23_09475 [Methylophaga sp.]
MSLTEQVNKVIASITDDIKNNKLSLPSPPDLLVKTRQIMRDDKTTSNDIAELVKHDANISGRLIKIANSVLFGARIPSTTVNAAVSRLGFKTVQNLITGLAIAQNFMSLNLRGLESYIEQIWQQSNKVASISYALAAKKSNVDPEQALLAGMVHNIGVLPLMLRLNKIPALGDNPKVYAMVADVVIPKLYVSAGKLIMDNWNFPDEITATVVEHRNLNYISGENIDLTDIVIIAYHLAQISSFSVMVDEAEHLIQSALFSKFWASPEVALEELSAISADIDEMQQSMSI